MADSKFEHRGEINAATIGPEQSILADIVYLTDDNLEQLNFGLSNLRSLISRLESGGGMDTAQEDEPMPAAGLPRLKFQARRTSSVITEMNEAISKLKSLVDL